MVFNMKKLIAIILTLGLIGSLPGFVLAAPPETIETSTDSAVIPVLGYLGPDVSVIPPDPETPPELEIYVEIPVQILFATFESGEGLVSSPRYTIKNLSEKNAVKVEIESFNQRADPPVELDGGLSLTLVDYDLVPLISDLFPAEYGAPKLLAAALPAYIEGETDNTLEFMVGGMWTGDFETELRPVFDLVIKLSAV